jgi:hypothetical protein
MLKPAGENVKDSNCSASMVRRSSSLAVDGDVAEVVVAAGGRDIVLDEVDGLGADGTGPVLFRWAI